MVQLTLPNNSKINQGINHKSEELSELPKKLIIYRWNPDDDKN